jgi:hypothetical protein
MVKWLFICACVATVLFLAMLVATCLLFAYSSLADGQHNFTSKTHYSKQTKPLIPSPMSMYSGKLVIGGIVRDTAQFLPRVLACLEKLEARLVVPPTYVFYENDSTDSSVDILERFLHDRDGKIVSEKNIQAKFPKRTVRLAYARNKLQSMCVSYGNVFMMLDMDNVCVNIDTRAVVQCLNEPSKWDVATANQRGQYYDLWALRTAGKSNNCWHNDRCPDHALRAWFGDVPGVGHRSISTDRDYIYVESAFGGLGLYKWSYWKAGRFVALQDRDCEHVGFFQSVRNIYPDVRVAIVPYLVNH